MTPDGTPRHTDTRTLTDPHHQDRISLFPAVLAEKARVPSSPPNNSTLLPKDLPTQLPAPLALTQSPLESAPNSVTSPPDHIQNLWDIDQVEPGTVLFSTGPVMTKPPLPNADSTRPSVDRSLWSAPSGVPSNVSCRVVCGCVLQNPDCTIFIHVRPVQRSSGAFFISLLFGLLGHRLLV